MTYFQLFLSFLQVGLFSIGGGYAAMPLIQNQVTVIHRWLTMGEFTDLITIAEMTPGPIAINAATFTGFRIAGIGGALIATLGCILPACFIVSGLYFLYYRFKNGAAMQGILGSLRPAVVAMIGAAGLTILQLVAFQGEAMTFGNLQWMGLGLFAAALLLLRKFKWSPILVMVLCGIGSLLFGLLFP